MILSLGTWRDMAACRHHDPELFFPIGPPDRRWSGPDRYATGARCESHACAGRLSAMWAAGQLRRALTSLREITDPYR